MDILKVDGNAFSSDDFIVWLKLSGRFSQVAEPFIKEKMAASAARKSGIEVSVDELQTRADDSRRALGLHRAREANEFLDESGASLEDFEAYVTDNLLAEKMRQQVQNDDAVEGYFKLHSPRFEAIELSHIVVDNEDQAKEILSLLAEGEETFAELARDNSLAESARQGGVIGRVLRGQLSSDLEAQLFGAEVGEPVGPFPRGDQFELFVVDERAPAKLNATTVEMIENLLYSEWLEKQAQQLQVQI